VGLIKRPALVAFVALALAHPVLAGEPESSVAGDDAFRHVLALARTIGPRKTGSEGDRLAVEYVRGRMEAAGLSVSLQEIAIAPYQDGERSLGSRNVIGRLEGTSPETVIVTAHHDSASDSIPGANDDASGVAVLLEAARAAARRPHRLTYLFISFCAEEEGLLGSRFYVEREDLSRVKAMIALELVGRGELLVAPVPRPPALWAQKLLLSAAREARIKGVASRPLWAIAPRFLDLQFSSDHESFLDRQIPAFLLAGTYPAWTYHTVEDSVGGIRKQALERAVRVVDRILQDLDGAPLQAADDPHYLPVQIFGQGFILPSRALASVAWSALLGWVLLVFWRIRAIARPRAIIEAFRVILVAAAATAVGLSGMIMSELLMEVIHGKRYPWMAHHGLHVAQAVAWTLLTGWIALNLFRRIKPTVEPGPYLAAAYLVPAACVAAALRAGWPELAVFMAVPVLAFLVSPLLKTTGRKLALGLVAAAPFTVLLNLDDYRALVDLGGMSFPLPVLFAAVFAVTLPLVLYLAHVASFQDCLHSRFWWWLSGRRVGVVALALSVALTAINAFLPAYDDRHRQVVRVRQRLDLGSQSAVATMRSRDNLDGVRLSGSGGRALPGGETTDRIRVPFPSGRVEFEAGVAPGNGGEETVVTTRLKAPIPTERISYVFSSRSGFRVPGRGDELRHRYTFTETIPRRDPLGMFRLLVPEGGDLLVELRADFEADLLGLHPVAEGPRVFVHVGTIEGSRRLLGPARTAAAQTPGEAPPADPGPAGVP
jgi:hypothetical protein